jgi:hypothetical protein
MRGGGLGLVFFLLNCLLVLLRKHPVVYKTMLLLIMALPFSFIGIGGIEMTHVISWYNIFLVTFILLNIKHLSLSGPASLSIIVVFSCLFIGTFWASDTEKAWIEIMQIMVMLLPTVLIFCSRKIFPLSSNEIIKLLSIYGHVAFCTSIGMILQYYFVFFRGTDIGIVNYSGAGRIQCYVLFRGASILPIFMGSGFVTLFMQNLYKRSITDSLEMIIIFFAMVLNSSRTGIFALFCIIAYVMLIRLKNNFSFKTFLLIAILSIGALWGLDYIMSTRENLESFTDDNGRETTWINGLNIWLDNPRNFFFGEGFTGGMWDGITKTHNFVIQTLAQNGIIVATIVFGLIFVFVKTTWRSSFKYIGWYILLSCLLVTDIYANAFTSVAFILICLQSIHSNLNFSISHRKLL